MELIGPKPERRIVIYFILAIMVGTVLLSLPISSPGKSIRFIDALFTSASAVCVTGLTVLDTGRDFSTFGQLVILVLIQLGGLGIMTFASFLLISIVPRLSFKDRFALSQTLGGKNVNMGLLLKAVISTTLAVELIGALLLFLGFSGRFPVGQAAFHAVFHSVSAFCNAGFSTFNSSLEGYGSDYSIIAIFSGLIILGGLGFVVIYELVSSLVYKRGRLSLHTKICLAATLALLVGGTVAFLLAEYPRLHGEKGLVNILVNSFFQAVTCRTAGFNTISQANLTEVSLLLTVVLMFIGACPGSTGGGIKTTTVTIMLAVGFNRFLGRRSVRIFRRSVGEDSIGRAVTVFLMAVAVICVMFVFLMYAEEKPLPHKLTHGWFIESLFEVFSAFGTVGLSLGVTSHLHDTGKIIIILLMFIGRVGLLTLVFSLARPPGPGEIVYIEEQIMVG